jgi:hypothetical protein
MNKIHFIICTLCIATSFFTQSCDQEDPRPLTKSKVTFTFSADFEQGRTASTISNATTLVLSLESPGGTVVMSQQKINLLSFNGDYVTEPIELTPGSYVITDFMLTNDSSEVLFATPQAGSPLASIVRHPLHYNFSVAKNKIISVAMEVVPVDAHSPADFGYASFGVHVVRPLPIAVFVPSNGGLKFSSGTAYIIHGGDTLASYTLGAKLNLLPFRLDPDESYRLDIIKDAYGRYSTTFVYNDLMDTLDSNALNAYLNPAITFRMQSHFIPGFEPDNITIDVGASSTANIIVDWGDGIIEPITIGETTIEHWYPNASATYFVSVTGAIDKVQQWFTNPDEMDLLQISFDHASDLRATNFYFDSPYILDLSKNNKMEGVTFSGKKLILPSQHNLKAIGLTGLDLQPQLDQIIHNIYLNTVTKGIMSGVIEYELHQDSGGTGADWSSLSPATFSELQDLYYSYGWSIYPGVE